MPLVGLALRANLAAPVGVWLQRVLAMVPDPVRTGASPPSDCAAASGRLCTPLCGDTTPSQPYSSQPFPSLTLYSSPPPPLTFAPLHGLRNAPYSVIYSCHAPTISLANHTLVTLSPRGLQPRSPLHLCTGHRPICTFARSLVALLLPEQHLGDSLDTFDARSP